MRHRGCLQGGRRALLLLPWAVEERHQEEAVGRGEVVGHQRPSAASVEVEVVLCLEALGVAAEVHRCSALAVEVGLTFQALVVVGGLRM